MIITKKNLSYNTIKIYISGRIDTLSVEQFRKTVADFAADTDEVIFDFSKVNYISSAGLREILICRKKFSAVRIENVSKSVFEIFSMTGFDNFIPMTISEDDAPKVESNINEFEGVKNFSFSKFLHDKAISDADKIAVVQAGENYSWRDIERGANKIAADLAEKNVRKGSHVAICGSNSINWILTFFAVQKLGAIAVLMNFNLSAHEISKIIDYTDVTHFCYGEMSADLDELKKLCGKKIQIFYSFSNNLNFKKCDNVDNNLNITIRADDPAVMIFTSGTTGKLKGVLLSAYNIYHQCRKNKFCRSNAELFR